MATKKSMAASAICWLIPWAGYGERTCTQPTDMTARRGRPVGGVVPGDAPAEQNHI